MCIYSSAITLSEYTFYVMMYCYYDFKLFSSQGIVPTFIILAVNRGFTSSGAEAYSGSTAYASGSGSMYFRKGTGVERKMDFSAAPNTSRIGQTETVVSDREYPMHNFAAKGSDF